MTLDQALLFGLFFIIFGLFLWGRVRYDIVALGALAIAALMGLVPTAEMFSGFGHPATLIVALVLIVSAGLMRSGAVGLLTKYLANKDRSAGLHIVLVGGVGTLMSGFMNNIAALALLMPLDMQTARRAGRAVGVTLMPLAFLTILGGMITMIGTPPNIIVATFRADVQGAPFQMFDFAPVGGAVALAGVLFVALIGWRLVPVRKTGNAQADLEDYIAELVVSEKSPLVGMRVADIEAQAEEKDAAIFSILRGGRRRTGAARNMQLQVGDVLLVEATPEALEEFRSDFKLSFVDAGKPPKEKKDKEDEETPRRRVDLAKGAGMVMIEVVVQKDSRIAGNTAQALGLSWRQDSILMGLSRQGMVLHQRIRRTIIKPGDILLLLVPQDRQNEVVDWLDVILLSGRSQAVIETRKIWIAISLFLAAIVAAGCGILTLPVALVFVIIGYVLTRIIPIEELYHAVDWPVIVLLGSMIPLGLAIDSTGGAALIAQALMTVTADLPPWAALVVLMVLTMTLSDILNNNATTILAAPVGIRLADLMEVNPDPFLMGVAIAASCAFLTPIGHQNNTVIMGPAGYRFTDYWRMGLPLELIVLAVGVPMILWVWPM